MTRYEEFMGKARRTNASRDADERRNGLATPTDADDSALLSIAMMAVEAGIETQDWNAVAEAQVMLEDLRARAPER